MKIDSTTNVTHLQSGIARETQRTTSDNGVAAADPTSASWTPSSANDTSRDIDTARVDEIRQAIRDGRFEIRSDRIADGLIQSARELVSDQS